MARATFINATLSGKLGGSVYARNKGGAYVRTFVKPTNPNTTKQAKLRAGFSTMSKSWGGLDSGEQAAWNSYAINYFRPKRGKAGVVYSGFNAYQSLNNAWLQADANHRVLTLTTPTGTTVTATISPQPTVAPSGLFGGEIQGTGGAPIAMTLRSATLSAAGAFTATLDLSAATPAAGPTWADPVSGRRLAFVAFGNLAGSTSPRDITCIGASYPITSVTGWTGALSSFTIAFGGSDIDLSIRKLWYAAGNKMIVSLYALSDAGEYAYLGNAPVIVT